MNSILRKSWCLFGCFIINSSLLSAADEETITIAPVNDTTLSVFESSSEYLYENWGSRHDLSASFRPVVLNQPLSGDYILLRFNLSSIPKDTKIVSSSLDLTHTATRPLVPSVLRVWQMTRGNREWVQGDANGVPGVGATGRYLNQTSYSTPKNNSGVAWASGKAFNQGPGDIEDELGSLIMPPNVDKDRLYSIKLDILALEKWRNDAELQAAGLVVHLTGYSQHDQWITFYSTKADVPEKSLPHLTITYQK